MQLLKVEIALTCRSITLSSLKYAEKRLLLQMLENVKHQGEVIREALAVIKARLRSPAKFRRQRRNKEEEKKSY